jgi:hypothetical protein
MESSLNITAPPKFKPDHAELNASKAMNVFVPQGNDEASAESDSQIPQPPQDSWSTRADILGKAND